MNKQEFGPTQIIYSKNGIAAKDGPIKPGSDIKGPENAGVTMRGIFMDAAGDLNTKTGEQKLTPGLKSVVKHGTSSIFL